MSKIIFSRDKSATLQPPGQKENLVQTKIVKLFLLQNKLSLIYQPLACEQALDWGLARDL